MADATNRHKEIMLITFIGSVAVRCAMVIKGDNDNRWLSFLVAFAAILSAPVKPLMDGAVIASLSDKAEYGKSRLFGQIGFGIGAYIGGWYLRNSHDMRKLFAVHAITSLLAACLMAIFSPAAISSKISIFRRRNLYNKYPKENNGSSIDMKACMKIVFSRADMLTFFFVVFLIGVSSGVVENFAYVLHYEIPH